ncbi:hypothetical protein GCM10010272_08150 [Streptomyces lateritius]|nr:hypothetical protein GCM10010272_08150 [Streptomyces lateritius]
MTASPLRSTIRVRARPTAPPWPTPRTADHSQAPCTGTISSPAYPSATIEVTSTTRGRWLRIRQARSGTAKAPATWMRLLKAKITPAVERLIPWSVKMVGIQAIRT